jgi:hypothetical protein
MAFAGTGWPEQMDDLGAVDEVETGQRIVRVYPER